MREDVLKYDSNGPIEPGHQAEIYAYTSRDWVGDILVDIDRDVAKSFEICDMRITRKTGAMISQFLNEIPISAEHFIFTKQVRPMTIDEMSPEEALSLVVRNTSDKPLSFRASITHPPTKDEGEPDSHGRKSVFENLPMGSFGVHVGVDGEGHFDGRSRLIFRPDHITFSDREGVRLKEIHAANVLYAHEGSDFGRVPCDRLNVTELTIGSVQAWSWINVTLSNSGGPANHVSVCLWGTAVR